MAEIHSTAIVHPKVELDELVKIGPYCIVEEGARISSGTELQSHVIVRGNTLIGKDVKIFPFACVGMEPQHLKYRGEPTQVIIGDRVVLRESVTVHRGTPVGTGVTEIKNDCYLMAYVHVAHDCIVGEKTVIANDAHLAGHVEIGKNVLVGGVTGITQFCRVGDYSFIGAGSTVRKDFPPYLVGKGDFEVQGINSIGLERQGFSKETILSLRKVFKIFFLEGNTVGKAIEKVQVEVSDGPEVQNFINFIKSSKVGVLR